MVKFLIYHESCPLWQHLWSLLTVRFLSLFIQFLQWYWTKKQKPHDEILQISAINWGSCQSIFILKSHYSSQCLFSCLTLNVPSLTRQRLVLTFFCKLSRLLSLRGIPCQSQRVYIQHRSIYAKSIIQTIMNACKNIMNIFSCFQYYVSRDTTRWPAK